MPTAMLMEVMSERMVLRLVRLEVVKRETASPMMGQKSGAMIMAPMTTAAESWRRPRVAMMVEARRRAM